MTPSPVGVRIQLALQSGSGLHPGETVTVHVIKRLDTGKWAVGVLGRVYPASSELPLAAGAVLRARVSASAGKLVLTVSDVVPDALLTALQAQGVPTGGPEELIARTLARAGLPLLPETIQKVKALLTRVSALDDRKSMRSAVTLVDKRIDPGSSGAASLLKVFAFGQKGGDDPRRYRGRPLPETARAVKEFAEALPAKASSTSSSLQAFNHSAPRNPSWVVIPFLFTSGAQRIAGTLKILFDSFTARPHALTLVTEGVALHLGLIGKRRALSVYCDSVELQGAAARGLDSLRAKFHNMGLEVDDTIKEGNAFDGFTPVEQGEILPSVDTVG
jgi:hypothetical protein